MTDRERTTLLLRALIRRDVGICLIEEAIADVHRQARVASDSATAVVADKLAEDLFSPGRPI